MNFDNLKIAFQYALPKHGVSKLVGFLARAKLGFVTTGLIKSFVKAYDINMDEAKHSDPAYFKTFNDFFTRELAEGVRPIIKDENKLAHPVDGAVSQLGPIKDGTLVQAKNHYYSTLELVGGDQAIADKFEDGDFATIYLAPSDYHRLHMPVKGTLTDMIYVPGDAFSVNPLTAANVPNLFARNERVVCIFDTEIGPMAMVLVGATIVRSIETVWEGNITPPRGTLKQWTYPSDGDDAIVLDKGEEMGRFKLGSTVVCLFGKDKIKFVEELTAGSVTRLGEHFADVV
ncbi:archaetidylserine decarboxylase [uncultured Psychrosphaera sp.]|uniref:archaetidylserine decarboxylase n=1 Tax=uncultured Psychrosphaera sp. TaxID=1403522 RepID=UPI0026351AA0|nr:archaetidylserine decarboxylase [uncultured Psychrosphaera sp.]